MSAITGSSSTDIYAFGSYSYQNDNPPPNFTFKVFAAHFNGTAWQEISLPQGEHIFGVNHDSPTVIYGVGTYGQLFKFDGSLWTVDTVQTPASPDIWMTIKVIGTAADSGVMILFLDRLIGLSRSTFRGRISFRHFASPIISQYTQFILPSIGVSIGTWF